MKPIQCIALVMSLLAWQAPTGRLGPGEAEAKLFATPTRLMRASNFIGSIGVNTHLAWSGPWADFGKVEAELAFLGVANIRDSVPTASTLGKYLGLAAKSAKFDIIVTGPAVDIDTDLERIDRLQALAPRSVAAVEGVNEFNVNHATFNGRDSFNDYLWGRMLDEALSKAVRADAHLKDVEVIGSSLAAAGPPEIAKQGDLSQWVDASNWHAYFSHGEQPSRNIRSAAVNARSTAAGKPVILTEAGYYTALDAMAWGGGGVDEDTQAKMTLNLLLDAAEEGVARTYLYELMDNVYQPAPDDLEGSFGIFRGDGRPKLVATAIHNLVDILSDKHANAATFAAAPLSYTLCGATFEDRSLLIARSDGVYDLILWNEARIWDEGEKHPVASRHHFLTIQLDPGKSVEIFDPLASTNSVESVDSKSIDVSLSDHPLVIAISPFRRSGRQLDTWQRMTGSSLRPCASANDLDRSRDLKPSLR